MPDDSQFDLDAYVDTIDLPPYTFKLGGKQRTLPNFSTLSIQQGVDIDNGKFREVVAKISDDELADLIVNLPGIAANKLSEKWMAHAQVTPGESRASSRS